MKRKTICRCMKAGILGSLIALVLSGAVLWNGWEEAAQADCAYRGLRERVQPPGSRSGAFAAEHAPRRAPEPAAGSRQDPSDGFEAIRKEYGDVVGWLTCEETAIDYPVLHTDDNDFYLKHLYDGQENPAGSLFVDFRNTGSFADRNTVIYGHNMKNGTMFASLVRYQKQSYFDSHPVMKLRTPDGDFLIELVSGTLEDGTYDFLRFEFESDADFMDYISDLKSRSTFQSGTDMEPGDRIVSLCTCSYERENGRYLVVGKLSPLAPGAD